MNKFVNSKSKMQNYAKSLELAKNFFESAIKYLEFIESTNQNEFIYPRIFNERHALELMLKAYIYYNLPKQKVICNTKRAFTIQLDNQIISLKTHSLLNLFLIAFKVDNKLIHDFTERELILKEVKRWNKYDPDNEKFKYPVSSKGKMKSNIIFDYGCNQVIVSEITSKIAQRYFLVNDTEILQLKIDNIMIEYSEFLRKYISLISNLLANNY